MGLGNDADECDFNNTILALKQLEEQNTDKITEGIFAPWCMYKEDFFKVGGHDILFAPQSKEDSDLFNRFHLNGYNFIQSWDGLVYHFTSRGSRFNKHSGGGVGVNSSEWVHTTTKNGKNFIRKWGSFVSHTDTMKPIVKHKYDIGVVIKNCTPNLLQIAEVFSSNVYTDLNAGEIKKYIDTEQPNTLFQLKERLKSIDILPINDIVIQFDGNNWTESIEQILVNFPDVISKNEVEIGEYEFDNCKITINSLKFYENNLIVCNK